MDTNEKLAAASVELGDALRLLNLALRMEGPITVTCVAEVRRKVCTATAKLVSVESELAILEEGRRK